MSSAFQAFERSDTLRPELLSHLSVVVIRVPPLREYPEDVPELLRHHVDLLVDTEGLPFRRFSVAAQNRLRNYPWPRNVRELRNMVKRLLILGGPEEISLTEVEAQLATDTADREPLVKQDLLAMPLREAREHFERAYLQQQLLLVRRQGRAARQARRHGAHASLPQAALSRRRFSPVVDGRLIPLVRDLHQQRVDTRVAQPTLRALGRVEIADRADAHAVEHVVLERDALHVGLEPEQREAGLEPVRIGRGAERTGLQQEAARSHRGPPLGRRRRGDLFVGHDDLELRQDFVEIEAILSGRSALRGGLLGSRRRPRRRPSRCGLRHGNGGRRRSRASVPAGTRR